MKFLILSACVLMFTSLDSSFAQNKPSSTQNSKTVSIGKIDGKLVDSKGNPIGYATVTLLRKDTTVVNGDLSKEDGSFHIEPTGLGNFMLRINSIGFNDRYLTEIQISKETNHKKLGKITLSAAAVSLNEITITGEKAMMEMSVDKKVFNVEKNTTSSGGSATDVLKNIPSLAVDVDGDILLRGKETTLLIDGKPATLLGGDVASALQSLPASSIQNIEIITNPSARYDAQGMSGIINIITKKDSRFGFNGNASVGVGSRDKYNASLGMNMRNNKWNIFLNSSYRMNPTYQNTSNERKATTGELNTGSYEELTKTQGGLFNSIGAEFTPNANNTFSLTQNINWMLWGSKGNTNFDYYSGGAIYNKAIRSSDNMGGPLSSSTSLDYKHKMKKPKQEISSNVTFARTNVVRRNEFSTNYFDASMLPIGNPVIQSAPGRGGNTSLNAQVDFTTPFLSPNGRLDAGWKMQLFWFESSNNAKIDKGDGNGFVQDGILQTDYKYQQQQQAFYANFNDQRGKFGYQLGLRYEFSKYDGTSSLLPSDAPNYGNQFSNFFPSAFVSYKLSDNEGLFISYTRRINRPSFFQMMPYKDVSNPMDTSAGNPDLIPEFIHNSEINYSRQFKKGHSFMASGYYQFTQNIIDKIKRFSDDSSGRSFTMPQNLKEGVTFGLELTGKFQLLPIWDATLNFNFFRNEILSGGLVGSNLNNTGTSWFSKFNSNIKLPKNYSVQLSGTYEAPKVAAQGKVLEVYWIDVAIKKSFWNNQANVVLNVSDVLDSRKYTNLYEFTGANQYIYRDRETRIVNLTFSYRFGKGEARTNMKKMNNSPVKERDNIKQGDGEQSNF